MRIAPSLLLSLLFSWTIVWASFVSSDVAAVPVLTPPAATQSIALSDVGWMAEMEEDVELEEIELTVVRGSRLMLAAVTLEDRTEAFWPPRPLILQMPDHLGLAPAQVQSSPSHLPRLWLRPPRARLQTQV